MAFGTEVLFCLKKWLLVSLEIVLNNLNNDRCEGCCHYLLFLYGFVLFLLWLCHINIPNRRCSIVRLGCLCGYMYVWRLMYVKGIEQFQMSFLILIFFEAQSLTGMEYTKSCRLGVQQDPGNCLCHHARLFFFFVRGLGVQLRKSFFSECTSQCLSPLVGL